MHPCEIIDAKYFKMLKVLCKYYVLVSWTEIQAMKERYFLLFAFTMYTIISKNKSSDNPLQFSQINTHSFL